MKAPAALGLAVIVGVCTFSAVIATHNPPTPPNFTPAEMDARVKSFVKSHVESCEICSSGQESIWSQCPGMYVAYRRGITVGNWRQHPFGWDWVGRPVPCFRWDCKEQRWRRLWPYYPLK